MPVDTDGLIERFLLRKVRRVGLRAAEDPGPGIFWVHGQTETRLITPLRTIATESRWNHFAFESRIVITPCQIKVEKNERWGNKTKNAKAPALRGRTSRDLFREEHNHRSMQRPFQRRKKVGTLYYHVTDRAYLSLWLTRQSLVDFL